MNVMLSILLEISAGEIPGFLARSRFPGEIWGPGPGPGGARGISRGNFRGISGKSGISGPPGPPPEIRDFGPPGPPGAPGPPRDPPGGPPGRVGPSRGGGPKWPFWGVWDPPGDPPGTPPGPDPGPATLARILGVFRGAAGLLINVFFGQVLVCFFVRGAVRKSGARVCGNPARGFPRCGKSGMLSEYFKQRILISITVRYN